MKRNLHTLSILFFVVLTAQAQPKFSQPHGLYDGGTLTVEIISDDAEATIHFTTDGSEPTATSQTYTAPLTLAGNTLLRAAEVKGDTLSSPIATATYLFVNDVLRQSDTPEGYPTEWGSYTQMAGTAVADYGMDKEMTTDAALRPKIVEGLKSLPILSIVTDKDNLFSHELDEEKGGIYIFTGPPVGDATGHGWTRPASIELMGGGHDLAATCGLRLHGGHGRLAEKNPKHSFRLVFKEKYGEKTLKYPLFGEEEPAKFDQLVLRCHFGNAWQHWMESNRQKAQYTRDVWARRMQRKMGHTSVNALYVHLFLNGMYWGLYNIAERVDDQFGKDHLGGKKGDIDVLKIEEDGGNHIEASEGDLEAWDMMVATAAQVGSGDEAAYWRLQGKDADGNDAPDLEALLDVDNFIDYMLINQYAGNTDWDHHNWYALRRRGTESQGFRFLCWDSEIIFENEHENVLGKNNGSSYPTGIFHNLLQNEDFARRYLRRAKEVLAADGLLGEASVVAVWDSLYHTISTALYSEAARWGDYRRDVHPYTSRGNLYTVDDTYMTERNRLLQQYFPVRSEWVLGSIVRLVDVDDFEAPDGWEKLTASMFHEWDGTGADAQPKDKEVNVDWNMNQEAGGGTAVAGFVGVEENRFADITGYEKLVLRGTGSGLRILANRLVSHGPWKQITVSFNDSDPYWDADLEAIVLPLADLQNALTSEGVAREDDFLHLHALKVDWSKTACVRSAYLVPTEEALPVMAVTYHPLDGKYYTLQGVQVEHPTKGVYIYNGKKVYIP
ncbi:MAG: CotH kinase family protein [Bacteroidaceae bacterium]|nr:CotH kinase family protein [Bacteroidaceae bacterium]